MNVLDLNGSKLRMVNLTFKISIIRIWISMYHDMNIHVSFLLTANLVYYNFSVSIEFKISMIYDMLAKHFICVVLVLYMCTWKKGSLDYGRNVRTWSFVINLYAYHKYMDICDKNIATLCCYNNINFVEALKVVDQPLKVINWHSFMLWSLN